jgi:hypothetical protein
VSDEFIEHELVPGIEPTKAGMRQECSTSWRSAHNHTPYRIGTSFGVTTMYPTT